MFHLDNIDPDTGTETKPRPGGLSPPLAPKKGTTEKWWDPTGYGNKGAGIPGGGKPGKPLVDFGDGDFRVRAWPSSMLRRSVSLYRAGGAREYAAFAYRRVRSSKDFASASLLSGKSFIFACRYSAKNETEAVRVSRLPGSELFAEQTWWPFQQGVFRKSFLSRGLSRLDALVDGWEVFTSQEGVAGLQRKEDTPEGVARWSAEINSGRILHGFEQYSPDRATRASWAFAIESEDSIDIEELYVRPPYRSRAYGIRLGLGLANLASQQSKRLRALVPHSDEFSSNPGTRHQMCALLASMGLAFRRPREAYWGVNYKMTRSAAMEAATPPRSSWIAHYATDEAPGTFAPTNKVSLPPKPEFVLGRDYPTELGIDDDALGAARGIVVIEPQRVESPVPSFPSIKSAAWTAVSDELSQLISKKDTIGLSTDARKRYVYLQAQMSATVRRSKRPGRK